MSWISISFATIILTLQKHLNNKRYKSYFIFDVVCWLHSLILSVGYVYERITHMHEELVEGKTRYFFSPKSERQRISLELFHMSAKQEDRFFFKILLRIKCYYFLFVYYIFFVLEKCISFYYSEHAVNIEISVAFETKDRNLAV